VNEINRAGIVNAELMDALPKGGYILRLVYKQQEKVLKILN